MYGSKYWNEVINLKVLAEKGAISPKDLELFQFADTPEAAFAILKASLMEHLDAQPVLGEKPYQPVPEGPAPSAEELLGPGIARTLP
jgi:hypothetical protein